MQAPDSRKLLVIAGAATVACWALPGLSLVTLPIVYLNTHVHELSHALAAAVSGGDAQRIVVQGSGSGFTPVAGGSLLLVASAGYIGASLIGAALIAWGSTPRNAKNALWGLACLLSLSMLVWVRGDAVGIASGVFWILLLWVLGSKLQKANAVFAAQFLGMQQCLTSVQALFVLLKVNAIPGIENDAKLLADQTPLPPMFWALGWCSLSLAVMALALRRAWSGETKRRAG